MFREPVLFFDIDGTLVNPKTGKISPATMDAIKLWQNAGYLCCLASGRSYYTSGWTDAKNYHFDGFVGVNGQEVVDHEGKIIQQITLSDELILKTIATAKELGHILIFIEEEGWTMIGEENEFIREVISFLHAPMPTPTTYTGQKVLYAMIIAPRGYDYAPYEALGYHCAKSYLPYADLVLEGMSKAKGIQTYLNHMGLSKYYAFGDSMNDYEMLVHADKAIVMEEGDPNLLSIADYVAGPFEEEGLANTLYQLWEEKE